jgi:hypothetical protein
MAMLDFKILVWIGYIYIYIQAFEHPPKYPISTWVLEQPCVGLAILTSNMKASSMFIINLLSGVGSLSQNKESA